MSVPGEQLQTQARSVQQPYRWPLVDKLQRRDVSLVKDARRFNCYVEQDPTDGEVWIYKRPGVASTNIGLSSAVPGQGVYVDAYTGIAVWAAGTPLGTYTLFFDNRNLSTASSFTPASIPAWSTSFCSIRSNPITVFIQNSFNGFILNTTTDAFTAVTDTNFVAIGQLADGVVYLDGLVYVMDKNGGIWNSQNPNDGTVWNGANVIQASADADAGVAIRRHLNYIIAFKQNTVQVFYDAGNPVGSPLAPVPDSQLPYGCFSGQSVGEIDNILLWPTATQGSQPQVIMLTMLTPTIISTPAVEKLLSNIVFSTYLGSVPPVDTWGVGVWGWTLRLAGHRFYGITSIAQNITLVYDIDQQEWEIWTDSNGNYWPYRGMAYRRGMNDSTGHSHAPETYAQNSLTGTVHQIDTCYVNPTDEGSLIPFEIYTPNTDFGTIRRKTLHKMYFRGDKVPSFLTVRHSDNDYQTWSNFRQVDLNINKPSLRDEGTFEWRRAYHFKHFAATPYRIKTVDLQMDVGTL